MEKLAKGIVYESMLGLLEVEDVQKQTKKNNTPPFSKREY